MPFGEDVLRLFTYGRFIVISDNLFKDFLTLNTVMSLQEDEVAADVVRSIQEDEAAADVVVIHLQENLILSTMMSRFKTTLHRNLMMNVLIILKIWVLY